MKPTINPFPTRVASNHTCVFPDTVSYSFHAPFSAPTTLPLLEIKILKIEIVQDALFKGRFIGYGGRALVGTGLRRRGTRVQRSTATALPEKLEFLSFGLPPFLDELVANDDVEPKNSKCRRRSFQRAIYWLWWP